MEKKRTSMQKKIAMLESQVRATDSHVNGEEENRYAKKIAMLESQVRATDSHVKWRRREQVCKKDYNAWITGENHR